MIRRCIVNNRQVTKGKGIFPSSFLYIRYNAAQVVFEIRIHNDYLVLISNRPGIPETKSFLVACLIYYGFKGKKKVLFQICRPVSFFTLYYCVLP